MNNNHNNSKPLEYPHLMHPGPTRMQQPLPPQPHPLVHMTSSPFQQQKQQQSLQQFQYHQQFQSPTQQQQQQHSGDSMINTAQPQPMQGYHSILPGGMQPNQGMMMPTQQQQQQQLLHQQQQPQQPGQSLQSLQYSHSIPPNLHHANIQPQQQRQLYQASSMATQPPQQHLHQQQGLPMHNITPNSITSPHHPNNAVTNSIGHNNIYQGLMYPNNTNLATNGGMMAGVLNGTAPNLVTNGQIAPTNQQHPTATNNNPSLMLNTANSTSLLNTTNPTSLLNTTHPSSLLNTTNTNLLNNNNNNNNTNPSLLNTTMSSLLTNPNPASLLNPTHPPTAAAVTNVATTAPGHLLNALHNTNNNNNNNTATVANNQQHTPATIKPQVGFPNPNNLGAINNTVGATGAISIAPVLNTTHNLNKTTNPLNNTTNINPLLNTRSANPASVNNTNVNTAQNSGNNTSNSNGTNTTKTNITTTNTNHNNTITTAPQTIPPTTPVPVLGNQVQPNGSNQDLDQMRSDHYMELQNNYEQFLFSLERIFNRQQQNLNTITNPEQRQLLQSDTPLNFPTFEVFWVSSGGTLPGQAPGQTHHHFLGGGNHNHLIMSNGASINTPQSSIGSGSSVGSTGSVSGIPFQVPLTQQQQQNMVHFQRHSSQPLQFMFSGQPHNGPLSGAYFSTGHQIGQQQQHQQQQHVSSIDLPLDPQFINNPHIYHHRLTRAFDQQQHSIAGSSGSDSMLLQGGLQSLMYSQQQQQHSQQSQQQLQVTGNNNNTNNNIDQNVTIVTAPSGYNKRRRNQSQHDIALPQPSLIGVSSGSATAVSSNSTTASNGHIATTTTMMTTKPTTANANKIKKTKGRAGPLSDFNDLVHLIDMNNPITIGSTTGAGTTTTTTPAIIGTVATTTTTTPGTNALLNNESQIDSSDPQTPYPTTTTMTTTADPHSTITHFDGTSTTTTTTNAQTTMVTPPQVNLTQPTSVAPSPSGQQTAITLAQYVGSNTGWVPEFDPNFNPNRDDNPPNSWTQLPIPKREADLIQGRFHSYHRFRIMVEHSESMTELFPTLNQPQERSGKRKLIECYSSFEIKALVIQLYKIFNEMLRFCVALHDNASSFQDQLADIFSNLHKRSWRDKPSGTIRYNPLLLFHRKFLDIYLRLTQSYNFNNNITSTQLHEQNCSNLSQQIFNALSSFNVTSICSSEMCVGGADPITQMLYGASENGVYLEHCNVQQLESVVRLGFFSEAMTTQSFLSLLEVTTESLERDLLQEEDPLLVEDIKSNKDIGELDFTEITMGAEATWDTSIPIHLELQATAVRRQCSSAGTLHLQLLTRHCTALQSYLDSQRASRIATEEINKKLPKNRRRRCNFLTELYPSHAARSSTVPKFEYLKRVSFFNPNGYTHSQYSDINAKNSSIVTRIHRGIHNIHSRFFTKTEANNEINPNLAANHLHVIWSYLLNNFHGPAVASASHTINVSYLSLWKLILDLHLENSLPMYNYVVLPSSTGESMDPIVVTRQEFINGYSDSFTQFCNWIDFELNLPSSPLFAFDPRGLSLTLPPLAPTLESIIDHYTANEAKVGQGNNDRQMDHGQVVTAPWANLPMPPTSVQLLPPINPPAIVRATTPRTTDTRTTVEENANPLMMVDLYRQGPAINNNSTSGHFLPYHPQGSLQPNPPQFMNGQAQHNGSFPSNMNHTHPSTNSIGNFVPIKTSSTPTLLSPQHGVGVGGATGILPAFLQPTSQNQQPHPASQFSNHQLLAGQTNNGQHSLVSFQPNGLPVPLSSNQFTPAGNSIAQIVGASSSSIHPLQQTMLLLQQQQHHPLLGASTPHSVLHSVQPSLGSNNNLGGVTLATNIVAPHALDGFFAQNNNNDNNNNNNTNPNTNSHNQNNRIVHSTPQGTQRDYNGSRSDLNIMTPPTAHHPTAIANLEQCGLASSAAMLSVPSTSTLEVTQGPIP